MHFKMLSAICFNLDQSKLLSSVNGLKLKGETKCGKEIFSSLNQTKLDFVEILILDEMRI